MKNITYHVETINCKSCVAKIKTGLADTDGINSIEVSVENNTVNINGEDTLSAMGIKKTIEELGFNVPKMIKE